MASTAYLKTDCDHCNGPIEYPSNAAGQTIDCPHCGKPVLLPTPAAAIIKKPIPVRAIHPPQEVIIKGVDIPFSVMFRLVGQAVVALLIMGAVVWFMWLLAALIESLSGMLK